MNLLRQIRDGGVPANIVGIIKMKVGMVEELIVHALVRHQSTGIIQSIDGGGGTMSDLKRRYYGLKQAHAELSVEVVELREKVKSMKRPFKCPHHPEVNSETMWGCPDCLRELRLENSNLTLQNDAINKSWESIHADRKKVCTERDALKTALIVMLVSSPPKLSRRPTMDNICIGCLYRSKLNAAGERTCAVMGLVIEDFVREGAVSCSARVERGSDE